MNTFLLQKRFEHTCFVAKMIFTHFFCRKNNFCTFLSQKEFTHLFFVAKNDLCVIFVAKTIYALRPESFCALKVAIWKVQTFWASGGVVPPNSAKEKNLLFRSKNSIFCLF